MANYGLKIAKPGFDVKTCAIKDLAFYSGTPCIKILQLGKVSAVSSHNEALDATIATPFDLYVFLYDSADGYYKPQDIEVDTSYIYFPGGEASGSYYYYFIVYG